MGTDTLSDSSSEDNFSVGKRIFSKLDCSGSCHIIFLLIVCVSCSLFASPQMIIIAFILFSLSFTASFWYLQKRTGNNISGCRWASPMWYIEVALLLYKDIVYFFSSTFREHFVSCLCSIASFVQILLCHDVYLLRAVLLLGYSPQACKYDI